MQMEDFIIYTIDRLPIQNVNFFLESLYPFDGEGPVLGITCKKFQIAPRNYKIRKEKKQAG